ncbi:hypothetical protein B9037_009965 [Klebsiella aerogenes]|nr:hypothetical protein B9037_009965 [Klebsiella aerogenes]
MMRHSAGGWLYFSQCKRAPVPFSIYLPRVLLGVGGICLFARIQRTEALLILENIFILRFLIDYSAHLNIKMIFLSAI